MQQPAHGPRRPRFRIPRLPRPDLNEVLVLVGLPVCLVALWQLTPRAFWIGLALLGALAAGWGVYRAAVAPTRRP